MKNLITYEQFRLNESTVNEGAVKQFEVAMKNLINNIRAGYGWIDPEYVHDTVVTDGEFDDFNWKDIKDEVYQRLIDQNLLYYANDADPEVKGQKVSKVAQIKESVNEAKKQITIKFTKSNQNEVSTYVFSRLEHEKLVDTGNNGPDYMDLKFDAKNHDKVIDILRRCDAIDSIDESVNEASDEFVPATLTEDFEDLQKGAIVKIKAIEYTQGGDKETVESIRPDGNKMEIKKSVLTVKI